MIDEPTSVIVSRSWLVSRAMNTANFDLLNANGLNMQAVLNLVDLPEHLRAGITQQVPGYADYRQLILIGHTGREMWKQLQSSECKAVDDPIDSFSVDRTQRWCAEQAPEASYEIIYPASQGVVPLQTLGKLAGWHHDSPFCVGINQAWGSWFAYRVAILADSDFNTTEQLQSSSPCEGCEAKPCINACPANALLGGDFAMGSCINYRLSEGSRCKNSCLSRLTCPVADEHRYSLEQIHYHYSRSMKTIEDYRQKP